MTTVRDPSGTPVPAYNRSGTTIVDVSAAGAGTTGATPRDAATPIPAASGVTIALCTVDDSSPGGFGVSLPPNADVGDIVEVYALNGGAFGHLSVYCVSGETINGSNSVTPKGMTPSAGVRFRKVAPTEWRM